MRFFLTSSRLVKENVKLCRFNETLESYRICKIPEKWKTVNFVSRLQSRASKVQILFFATSSDGNKSDIYHKSRNDHRIRYKKRFRAVKRI